MFKIYDLRTNVMIAYACKLLKFVTFKKQLILLRKFFGLHITLKANNTYYEFFYYTSVEYIDSFLMIVDVQSKK